MSAMGFIPDILFLSSTFYFLVKYRVSIAKKILTIRLPKYLLFILTIVVLAIIEENINSGFPWFILPFIPWTVPILTVQVAITAWLGKKFKAKTIKWPLTGFVIFGVVWELSFGPLGQQFFTLPLWFALFMTFWMGLSYAYLAVVPLTMQLKK